ERYKRALEKHREYESGKQQLREYMHLTAADLRRIENAGGDYTRVPGFDAAVRSAAGVLPELGLGTGYEGGATAASDDATNRAERAWSLLREGALPKPDKASFIDEAAKEIQDAKRYEEMSLSAVPFKMRRYRNVTSSTREIAEAERDTERPGLGIVRVDEPAEFHQQFVGQFGKFYVYTVDGDAVRNYSVEGEDFSDWATHSQLHCIPPERVWVNDELDEDEQAIAASVGLEFLQRIDEGISPAVAASAANRAELKMRGTTQANQRHADKEAPREVPIEVYYDPIFPIDDGRVLCWFVNDDAVRSTFYEDWIEGGNHERYAWIPKGQIWVAKGQPDWPVILLHEFAEQTLMAGGMEYNPAHRLASQLEFNARHGGFTADDARALTHERVMQMILALRIGNSMRNVA
ncbi:MAG: hypothetical protein ACREQ5_03220, partial [Candidatus Dormibacteria bacterium]